MGDGKELLMAIDEIYHLFTNIRDIAEQQLLLARKIAGNPDKGEEMFGLLEHRQAIMDKIDRITAENPDCWYHIANDPKQKEILALTNSIQEYDQQSRKLMETTSKQQSNKFNNARNNIKAYDAYVPNAVSTEGWFFDRKK